MPTQIEKLQAYASHLLDDMIRLREMYAMLEPMLFEEEVSRRWGAGNRARGFVTLKNTLFISCAQGIAKIASDKYDRTPSVVSIVERLASDEIIDELRSLYSDWRLPIEEDDPVVAAALERMNIREQEERHKQFDSLYEELVKDWQELRDSDRLNGFQEIRDKVSAHTEIRYHEEYERVDIGSLGLKWGDLKRTITVLQHLVDRIQLLVRSASFAWEMLDEQLSDASRSFWLPAETKGESAS